MKALHQITLADLDACATGLEPLDWQGFASRVAKLHPALGRVQAAHAAAADGNSPPVDRWPEYALWEAGKLAEETIETPDDAYLWWLGSYGEPEWES